MSEVQQEASIEPGQRWEVDLLKPEDADGVRQLFLSVYGDGYPVRTYLEPEQLIAANSSGAIISSVARTPKGDIVGHNALYQSAPCKKIYEAGAGVVHRAYRGGLIFERVTTHSIDVGARRFNVEAVFGEAVCNHIISQKLMVRLRAVDCALEVDLMPATAYTKEKSAAGRVASVFGFITIKPSSHAVHLPRCYEEALRFLYAGLGEDRVVNASRGAVKRGAVTKMDVEYFNFAQVSRTAVWSAGEEFETAFAEREEDLLQKGATVLQVSLNLAEPWVEAPVQFLRRRGYFFCGILPRWLDADALLMTKILHRPSWEDIRLHTERAKGILEFVRADWETIHP